MGSFMVTLATLFLRITTSMCVKSKREIEESSQQNAPRKYTPVNIVPRTLHYPSKPMQTRVRGIYSYTVDL